MAGWHQCARPDMQRYHKKESHCLWRWRAYDTILLNKGTFFFFLMYCNVRKKNYHSDWKYHCISICNYVNLPLDFFGLGLAQRGSLNINMLWCSCCLSSSTDRNTKTPELQRKELCPPINQFLKLQDGENMDDSPNRKPFLHIQAVFSRQLKAAAGPLITA